jgi:hypothetical protein
LRKLQNDLDFDHEPSEKTLNFWSVYLFYWCYDCICMESYHWISNVRVTLCQIQIMRNGVSFKKYSFALYIFVDVGTRGEWQPNNMCLSLCCHCQNLSVSERSSKQLPDQRLLEPCK